MDSDAKMFVHHSHGTSRPRIKCWIMRQLIFTIQLSKKKSSSLSKTKSRNSERKKKWRGLQLLSGGNWFIGSILPASVLNAFRRGSLLSSSQQPPPTEETKKKSLDEKIRAKKNRQKKSENEREIRWLGSAG